MLKLLGNSSSRRYNNQEGQALLIVVLSLAVVLTIILSILSRSITDVSITSQSEESLRAFSAAEAGVERALIAGSIVPSTIGDASYSGTVTDYGKDLSSFTHPVSVSSGESNTFWFVAHNADGDIDCSGSNNCFTGNQFTICWGKPGTAAGSATTPAVEISTYYETTPGDASTTRIARVAADPNSSRRSVTTPPNNFSDVDGGTCTLGTDTFEFRKTVDLTSFPAPYAVPASSYGVENGLQFVKVRFFYNSDTSHPVGINVLYPGNALLPSQGLRINSTGVAGTSTRKIDVFQGFAELPPVFDSALFTLGGLTK